MLVWALLFSLDKAQGRISLVAIVSSISLGLLFAALLIRHVKIGMKSRFVIEDEGNLQWFNSIKHQLYRYSMFDSKIDYQHHSFYQHCALLMPATVSFSHSLRCVFVRSRTGPASDQFHTFTFSGRLVSVQQQPARRS